MNIEKIKAIVTAESPIAHSVVLSQEEDLRIKNDPDTPGNFTWLRRENFIGTKTWMEENDDGEMEQKSESNIFALPIVSGNAVRGVGRQLLMNHTFDDVLDINIGEIANDAGLGAGAAKYAAYAVQLFYKGGATPGGGKITYAKAGEYDKILRALPFLDLMGGVYGMHHFDSTMRVHAFIPVVKETWELFHEEFPDIKKPAMTASEMNESTNEERYTKHELAKTKSEGNGLMDEEQVMKTDKEAQTAMIYGTETIPTGTKFYFETVCISENDGTQKAFRAFNALLAQHGYVGGMSAKGHGKVRYSFDEDLSDAIKDYDEYLLAHKDEIIESISKIATTFKFTVGKTDEKKDGKGKAKKNTKAKAKKDAEE